MKSYSQYGEDIHIVKFFNGTVGRFLDLGAFDGITGSNTRALVDAGWSGVSVEANPGVFIKLINSAPNLVACVNAAVMDKPGIIQMKLAGQLTTSRMDNIPSNFVMGEFHVGAITPAMIAEQFGGAFDFISLDVEGVDLPVLRELAPVAGRARLLCIEDSIPFQAFDPVYYDQLRVAAAVLGFTKVIARTPDDKGTGNTLLAKT